MIETVELERIKFGLAMALDKEWMGASVEFRDDFFTDRIVMQAHGYLWGRNEELVEIRYPKDWREAFKERWFPVLLLKRYPVVYKAHRIDVREIYPDYRPAIPDQVFRLKLAKYDGTQSAAIH